MRYQFDPWVRNPHGQRSPAGYSQSVGWQRVGQRVPHPSVMGKRVAFRLAPELGPGSSARYLRDAEGTLSQVSSPAWGWGCSLQPRLQMTQDTASRVRHSVSGAESAPAEGQPWALLLSALLLSGLRWANRESLKMDRRHFTQVFFLSEFNDPSIEYLLVK